MVKPTKTMDFPINNVDIGIVLTTRDIREKKNGKKLESNETGQRLAARDKRFWKNVECTCGLYNTLKACLKSYLCTYTKACSIVFRFKSRWTWAKWEGAYVCFTLWPDYSWKAYWLSDGSFFLISRNQTAIRTSPLIQNALEKAKSSW